MYDRGWLGFHDIFVVLLVGTVFMWIRTFLLMPRRDTIPFPVPPRYRFGVSDWCGNAACAKIGVLGGDESDSSLGQRGSDTSFIYGERSLRDQWDSTLELAKSTSFISFNIWFIACNLRHVFFVSSANAWLSRMPGSDCEFVSRWTNFFGIAQFFGFAFAPIAGLFIDTLEEYFNRSISIAARQVFSISSRRRVYLFITLDKSTSPRAASAWSSPPSSALSSPCAPSRNLSPPPSSSRLYSARFYTAAMRRLLRYSSQVRTLAFSMGLASLLAAWVVSWRFQCLSWPWGVTYKDLIYHQIWSQT